MKKLLKCPCFCAVVFHAGRTSDCQLLASRAASGAGPQGRWHLVTVRQGMAPIPPPATRDGVFALPAYTGVCGFFFMVPSAG